MIERLEWVRETFARSGVLKASELPEGDSIRWFAASIDTRKPCSDRVFFALKGENTDGHKFVADAVSNGCVAVVVEDDNAVAELRRRKTPFFAVRSSLEALQELSRRYRQVLDVRIVAVTGSSGKTTTKEYIRMILKKKYRVHANRGNLNNHLGVPLTLLETDHEMEYLVSEVAANHAGEIDFLSELLKPDIGVVTNVGDAHIGFFGSRQRIAEAKSEIFTGIDSQGCGVLPGDDDFAETLSKRAACRLVRFGYGEKNDFRISGVERNGDRFDFRINDEHLTIRSFGAYNVANAGAAFAVGDLCGVESDAVRDGLRESEPMVGRARVHRGSGVTLVDDSYNANPASMKASVDALMALPATRRVAVLGDMAELGDLAAGLHRDIGVFLSRCGVDAVYWLGSYGSDVRAGIEKSGKTLIVHGTAEDLIERLASDIHRGDAVLVKASRSTGLDRIVEALLVDVVKEDED